MTFDEAVAALERRGPGRMIPTLDRIRALTDLLGEPQHGYPTVHVTGTNGKTSVTRMVVALLGAAGLSAGAFTSPHLQSVRERLRVAGRMIGPDAFAALHGEIEPLAGLVDRDHDDPVTYFELLTGMALWWFAERAVDAAVVEVGMGGTWDATNVVRGDVAVLGPVAVDHALLGSTPEEIAREKVGIVKDGAHVVSAAQRPGVAAILDETVRARGAVLWTAGRELEVLERTVGVGGQQLRLRIGDRTLPSLFLPLFGAHQADNALLAVGAFAALLGDSFATIEDDVVRQGLLAVRVPGRLEVVAREPVVLLDGAHNPHGAATAARAVEESFDFRSTILVAGCLADKDVRGVLDAWRPIADHVVAVTAPSPRGLPVDDLADVAEEVWGDAAVVERADDVDDALDRALGLAGTGDGVLVTGSLFTVGAARGRFVAAETEDTDDVATVAVETPYDEDADDRAYRQAIDELLDSMDDGTDED